MLFVVNVSAVFSLLACTASGMDVPWKAVCVCANYEYRQSLATGWTWQEAAAAASPLLVPDSATSNKELTPVFTVHFFKCRLQFSLPFFFNFHAFVWWH